MTPERIELARRLVASERWRWPEHVGADDDLLLPGLRKVRGAWHCVIATFDSDLPDLDSPLVKGWLLHLVREAWGRPGLTTRNHFGEWWSVWEDGPGANRPLFCVGPEYPHGPFPIKGASEVEALLAALLAAPETP